MGGQKFGILVVESDSGLRNSSKEILWLCRCACGGSTNARGYDLRRGDYQSCGCKKSENISIAKTEHGMSKSVEYNTWGNIIQRCTNPNDAGYSDYGGRGILVCDEWLKSFEVFYGDMGDRPSPEMSIDRIDNDKGYSKDNCRWATKSEQAFNKRKQKNCTSSVINVYLHKKSGMWMARKYDGKVREYLGTYSTEVEAIAAVERAK